MQRFVAHIEIRSDHGKDLGLKRRFPVLLLPGGISSSEKPVPRNSSELGGSTCTTASTYAHAGISRSVNLFVSLSVNRPVCLSTGLSARQFVCRQSVRRQSVCRQSITPLFIQSVSQSVCQSISLSVCLSHCLSVGHVCQSLSQSAC